jgi:DNA-binding transcriptional ArsR family regulator
MLYRSVKYKPNSLDAVFAALADPTRRAIAERLAEGPASMTELAEPFDVTLPAIVKQLAVLEHAGLVAHKKDGRVRYFTLVPGRLDSVAQWLEHRASSGGALRRAAPLSALRQRALPMSDVRASVRIVDVFDFPREVVFVAWT